MSCPHCHTELVADARFCPACGQATSPTGGHMAPTPDPDLVGREIGGRFKIIAKLGEGGMGSVYRAEQTSLRRPCAIKLLRPELSADPMLLRRFNAEAAAVAKLSHPNTVNIYDFGQDRDGSLFIAIELIEGRSLRKVVGSEAPLPAGRALAIVGQIAASLADAHAHDIVHRDLKPDNVMLQDRGRQRDVVRVLDFGIAKLRDDSRATQQAMTQAGDMLGTPQYMAPEQIKGEVIDGRTDIYALGCLLYELVTGRQPFEAPSVMAMLSKHLLEAPVPPSARRPDLAISPEVDRLVLSAMMKDPRGRPATMEQYGEQIAAVAASLPADPARPTAGATSAAVPVPSPPPGIYGTPAGAPGGAAVTPHAPSFTPGGAPGSYGVPGTAAPPHGTPHPGAVPYGMPPVPAFAPRPGFAPPPPGFARPGQPTVAQPRKSASLWIVLACAGVVVLAGGAWAIGVAMRSGPGDGANLHAPPQDPPPAASDPPDQADEPPAAPAQAQAQPQPPADPWAPGAGASPTRAGGGSPAPAEAPASAPAEGAGAARQKHAYSCEAVSMHLVQLALAQAGPAAAQQAMQQAQLRTAIQRIVEQCEQSNWPDSNRSCMMNASSYMQLAQCK